MKQAIPTLKQPVSKSIAPTCARCKYFDQIDHDYGRCRRTPPVIVSAKHLTIHGPATIFPVVDPGGWCGEFKE